MISHYTWLKSEHNSKTTGLSLESEHFFFFLTFERLQVYWRVCWFTRTFSIISAIYISYLVVYFRCFDLPAGILNPTQLTPSTKECSDRDWIKNLLIRALCSGQVLWVETLGCPVGISWFLLRADEWLLCPFWCVLSQSMVWYSWRIWTCTLGLIRLHDGIASPQTFMWTKWLCCGVHLTATLI